MRHDELACAVISRVYCRHEIHSSVSKKSEYSTSNRRPAQVFQSLHGLPSLAVSARRAFVIIQLSKTSVFIYLEPRIHRVHGNRLGINSIL
jgi:hypothetical protein